MGGPAAAGPIWIPELIAYCAKNQVPLDFISYHSYGVGSKPHKHGGATGNAGAAASMNGWK